MQSLLAYIALHPEPIARAKLAPLFWCDVPPDQARNSLRNALPVLRKRVACAAIAECLLRDCPRLRILATSRERLGIPEVAWLIPLFALPEEPAGLARLRENDGVQLFVARASAVRTDVILTEQNAPAIAQICKRLDGIPLAIGLAAARVLSVQEIAARLDDRSSLLTTARRTAPRQQTLRATIDWSYDLLSPDERTLFRRLAVFAGGATAAAVQAVYGGASASLSNVTITNNHAPNADGGGIENAGTISLNNTLIAGNAASKSPDCWGALTSQGCNLLGNNAACTELANGSNFVVNSVVKWNGSNRPTTYVNAGQLTAQISASDIPLPGTESVTVFNPAPGGGTSNTATLTVATLPNVRHIYLPFTHK